eukprot:SAG31_NODE_24598_length_478_cov_0.815303_1_plen_40_part_10
MPPQWLRRGGNGNIFYKSTVLDGVRFFHFCDPTSLGKVTK